MSMKVDELWDFAGPDVCTNARKTKRACGGDKRRPCDRGLFRIFDENQKHECDFSWRIKLRDQRSLNVKTLAILSCGE